MNSSPSPDQPSGFGFELTFRLLSDAETPPTWPAELLQALARYVFSSENALCVGDHISWHTALDQADSSIRHMLLTSDPQLKTIRSPLGCVSFVQVSTLFMYRAVGREGEREMEKEKEGWRMNKIYKNALVHRVKINP